jgi:thioredoxin-dependent peroxiredoxin
MATTKLKGNPIKTSGALPRIGSKAKEFLLTANNLSDKRLLDFAGKKIILNIFPSIDTAVCAMSVRRFNAEAAKTKNTVILCISRDLPFALARFCGAEGIENAITLSELRNREFGKEYGLEMVSGPLAGLLARAVIIIGTDGQVAYRELVDDITYEPDYETALKELKKIK